MPRFFTFLGFWIGRYSDEEIRPHVHAVKFGSNESMKVWLEPDVEVEYIREMNVFDRQQNPVRNKETQK